MASFLWNASTERVFDPGLISDSQTASGVLNTNKSNVLFGTTKGNFYLLGVAIYSQKNSYPKN